MLEERIMLDYKEAMKARDQVRSQTLSFLRAQLKYFAIEKKSDSLDDNDVVSVLKKLVKQRQDSIEQFKKGQRLDLVEKEEKELAVLNSYLPKMLSEGELVKLVEEVIASCGAQSMKDMGRVMKELLEKSAGAVDNKMASEIVRNKLMPQQKG